MQNEIIVTSFQKAFKDESKQALQFIEQNLNGQRVVKPRYSRQALQSYCENSAVNMRCLAVKSAVIAGLGYEFTDEENAKATGCIDFANGLIDPWGTPIGLSKMLMDLVLDAGIYAISRLEIFRIGGVPKNLYLLSSKNTYIDENFEKIIQYVTQPRQKTIVFRPYGEYSGIEKDTICFTQSIPGIDDFYGVPVYIPAAGAIQTNITASQANQEVMNNIANPSGIFVVKTDAGDEWHVATKQQIKSLKGQKGKSLYIDLKNDGTFTYQALGSQTIDGNYINERNKNELEIMASHGLTPELYGVLSNGGISSGEKATGALKIFLQTVVRPAQESLNKLMTNFFCTEFNLAADNEFQLKSIDLTDKLEDMQTEQSFAQVIAQYINLNNLRMLNEFLKSNGFEQVTEEEWQEMRTASTGINFDVTNQPVM